MRRLLLLVLTLVALGVLGVGCGEKTTTSAGDGRPTTHGTMPRLADGTVPWVDLPATDSAFELHPPATPTVADGAKSCTADQLTGALDAWHAKGDNDEGQPASTANGLLGVVVVRNGSDRDCTLQGAVPATLTADGEVVRLGTDDNINADAQKRVTPLPAGGRAQLRLDWSTPFCGSQLADQALELQLPHDGGMLTVPVGSPLQPACTRSETHPDLSSVLSSSAFDLYTPATPLDSPFNSVTVTVEPPVDPVPAHSELMFHVVLMNPTAQPIPFDPAPGYAIDLLAMGDASTAAVNTGSLQFLNSMTLAELPPGATRFEMRLQLPDALGADRDTIISWKLLDSGLNPADGKAGGFTFRTT